MTRRARGVHLPGGRWIRDVLDAEGHRVGEKVQLSRRAGAGSAAPLLVDLALELDETLVAVLGYAARLPGGSV